jgi:hypothetical protein
VAVVLINGGAVAIDPVAPAAPALVEAFYPSVLSLSSPRSFALNSPY